jgi:UDP-glucose 4-epimerase
MTRVLVTGSAGHLGDALTRVLRGHGYEVVGLDVLASPGTDVAGSITERTLVRECLDGVSAVLHAATRHKPHVGSHSKQDFVDTNVTGTLVLLEEAAAAGVGRFVFTSSTSAFGRALTPPPGAPAAWITEDVTPVPRNIYGVTKIAAENLAEIIHHERGLPVIVLRTSRFFPEADDVADVRTAYADGNVKANEYLYRRADLQDVVDAHLRAMVRAPEIGFGRYIISATTPFTQDDLAGLASDAPAVVHRLFPDLAAEYDRRGWRMFPRLDRVYVSARARAELGWEPRYDFRSVLDRLKSGEDPRSALARAVGAKGYHAEPTGVYTVRLPGNGAVAVEVAPGGAVRGDLGHPDDDLGAFLDGLGAAVRVEVGGGVAGIDDVDPHSGERLGVLRGQHVDGGLGRAVGERGKL